ncbi:hypothetical protein TNCV_8631 [Trichonephila clavipes]|nr:hypothetical protein TNCV_8631 [Trichonephila clavipes]
MWDIVREEAYNSVKSPSRAGTAEPKVYSPYSHYGEIKEGRGRQNGMKLPLLTSHVSVCNTTMVGFESGDTVERGC